MRNARAGNKRYIYKLGRADNEKESLAVLETATLLKKETSFLRIWSAIALVALAGSLEKFVPIFIRCCRAANEY